METKNKVKIVILICVILVVAAVTIDTVAARFNDYCSIYWGRGCPMM